MRRAFVTRMTQKDDLGREERKPEDLQDDGRTLSKDEKPVMEDLGTPKDDATPDGHSG